MYALLKPETGFTPSALSAAAKRSKEKLLPKPASAQNAQFASDRKAEKAAIAAQGGGRGKAIASSGRGGGNQANKPGAAAVTKPTDVSGSRGQWLSLLRLLRCGGREESGGLGR